jgi:hypothetical protein
MGIIAASEEKVQRNILKSCKSRIIVVRVCVRARRFLPELIVTLEKCSDHDNHDMCVCVYVCVCGSNYNNNYKWNGPRVRRGVVVNKSRAMIAFVINVNNRRILLGIIYLLSFFSSVYLSRSFSH